ncbi:tail fiber assembly protein [Pseudomonas sp. P1.31]|uniref:tail fiber assembly protein n=1 Tax=Pseudomonas sp. P1.31 TaxID=1699311 RepID=UPI00069EAF58|nr:tail fiber assembly protein [Pseudomonas sp. P1.31]
MNRYVLTISSSHIVVLQVLDTDGEPPAVPANEPAAAWRDVTGDTTAQPGMKMEYGPYGVTFTALTADEKERFTKGRMQERFDQAAQWMTFNPLQYKVDLGTATPTEEVALVAYKQYYVALSEVTNQNTFPEINWPVAPF